MLIPAAPDDAPLLVSTFLLRGALCGVETHVVEEVVRLQSVTRVARAPEYVLGIVNLRGRIVTVIDLARKLGLGSVDPGSEARLYIVQAHSESVGLLVDRAVDVAELHRHSLERPPANVSGADGRFFRWIGRVNGRVVAILDAVEALSIAAVPLLQ
jgi:purine-binding chemotaxis protein CheW